MNREEILYAFAGAGMAVIIATWAVVLAECCK